MFDVPFYASAGLRLSGLGVEGFAGYTLELMSHPDFSAGGPEFGARVHVFGLYVSVSQVLGAMPYRRFGFGLEVPDLL